jgi:hypothetical protein
MSCTSFWPNCPSSSLRKPILAWLWHQTCFQLSTETRVSSPFSDCDTLVLLSRVNHVRMHGKLEKVPTTLVFSVYWVSISMMVKTLNYPSHSIMSRIEFQQLGQHPKLVTLKSLIVWGRVNIYRNVESIIYNDIMESFLRILKSAQHRNFSSPADFKIS